MVHVFPVKARRPGLVSIVTPALNAEEFIKATVQSVLGQTYNPIEYIVVDGGSSDSTVQIVQKFFGRVRLIEAMGLSQSAAINAGFAASTGEFFTFINADDLLLPGAIASAVAALRAEPTASLAYGHADHIDAEGKILGGYPVELANADSLSRECVICQPSTLMRSEAFAALGGVDERLDVAMDYDLWLRMLALGRPFAFVPELLAQSRMHGNTKTLGRRQGVYHEVFAVLRSHFGYVPFNWIHAYAGYKLDGRDHFFDPPTGNLRRTLLTFVLGLSQNAANPWAFIADYYRNLRKFHPRKRP